MFKRHSYCRKWNLRFQESGVKRIIESLDTIQYHYTSGHCLCLEHRRKMALLNGEESSRTFGEFTNLRRRKKIMNVKVTKSSVQFSSVAQSCPTLRPHELQHTKPPCSSPTPGVHSNSHPSSRWCHLAISSSVVPFSSCPQSLPVSESFPIS